MLSVVIKLLAAAAVATLSIVSLRRLSTPARPVIPPDNGGTCPGNPTAPIKIELKAPIGRRKILDGLFLLPRPLS